MNILNFKKEAKDESLFLGGAGRICRETFWIWLKNSDFDVITIGDFNEELGLESVQELDDRRANF
ncbi:hypothetical protein [Bacillus xiapuensis]|uniref:PglD N-terminal domain-containing protein n=1 Tax=Bacillus xiapuensis TaxID=2014075 RepID=A0ABU6N9K3_9BACI|nr:hypothetical protein [Bacillus xiapuensis]